LLLLIAHNTPLARGCHHGSPLGSATWTWSLVTILIARLQVRFPFDRVTIGHKLRLTAAILTGSYHLHFIYPHEILTSIERPVSWKSHSAPHNAREQIVISRDIELSTIWYALLEI